MAATGGAQQWGLEWGHLSRKGQQKMGVNPRLDIAYKAGEVAMALCVFSPVLL